MPDEEELRFVLMLRRSWPHPGHPAVIKHVRNTYTAPQHRQPLTRSDIAALHGPAQSDIQKVEKFARDNDLQVVEASAARHDVTLTGSVSAINKAFHIEICHFGHEQGHFHGHEDEIRLPPEIHDIVLGVVGLDGAPLRGLARISSDTSHGDPVSIPWLTEHYKFPPPIPDGKGRVAVIALGGGFHQRDMDEFFDQAGLPMPEIRQLSVAGAVNTPLEAKRLAEVVKAFNDTSTDMPALWKKFGADLGATQVTAETTMDVQIAGVAGGGAGIDVYFAPNSAYGLYQALYATVGLAQALDPQGNECVQDPPGSISLSWGWGECEMTGRNAQILESALSKVQSMGVCICSASGDLGSLGAAQRDDFVATVLFPASSTSVLACGGTQFADASRQREIVWNAANRGSPEATGGGVSGALAMPIWQRGRDIPSYGDLNGPAWIDPSMPKQRQPAFVGRGVPDVAAYANQIPGYKIRLGGQDCGVGGTSAATPLWAGLIARLTAHVDHPLPYFNELIYDPRFASGFVPVTEGGNSLGETPVASFTAGQGWNACCGLGLPVGQRLLTLVNLALGR